MALALFTNDSIADGEMGLGDRRVLGMASFQESSVPARVLGKR